MMDVLDLIGAIAGTAMYAAMIAVLAGYARMPGALKAKLVTFAAGWLVLMVAVAALGGFAPGIIGAFPAPVIAFLAFLALLFGAWFRVPAFRAALMSLPLGALIGLNSARLGGIMFILLGAQGRLSDPFAPIAGAGDMMIGAAAIPLALMTAVRRDDAPFLVGVWNVLGALDLIVAITLATLSAPGTSFRVFTDGPGTTVMTGLPWIIVPTMLVPIYFLIHFVIAVRLRALRHSVQAVPVEA